MVLNMTKSSKQSTLNGLQDNPHRYGTRRVKCEKQKDNAQFDRGWFGRNLFCKAKLLQAGNHD